MTDDFNGVPDPPADDPGTGSPGDPAANQNSALPVIEYPRVDRNAARALLLRRLSIVLAVAIASFTLTVWLLVRNQSDIRVTNSGDPTAVVRSQLDAIARGDLRAAYALFSMQFRARVSFIAFHQLINTHPTLFHAQNIRFGAPRRTTARAVLDARIESENGENFTARFTLVTIQGRWWIDDIRFRRDEQNDQSSFALWKDNSYLQGTPSSERGFNRTAADAKKGRL